MSLLLRRLVINASTQSLEGFFYYGNQFFKDVLQNERRGIHLHAKLVRKLTETFTQAVERMCLVLLIAFLDVYASLTQKLLKYTYKWLNAVT